MKSVLLALLIPFTAQAGVREISDRDPNETLARIPMALVTNLRNGGVKFADQGNGVFSVSVKNLNCSARHNGGIEMDEPDSGVAKIQCRQNSSEDRGSTKGKLMAESLSLYNLLSDLQLDDCAMGQCGMFLPSLSCSVDTKVMSLNGQGRFSCKIEHTFD